MTHDHVVAMPFLDEVYPKPMTMYHNEIVCFSVPVYLKVGVAVLSHIMTVSGLSPYPDSKISA